MIFVVVLVIILVFTMTVFERKTLYGPWNYTLKVGGFTNLPENSVNVIGVGSSHMYCTLNPVYIYEQTGKSYYVLATQQQPVEATYYYVKEALEQQNPDVVIIEGLMYLQEDDVVTEGVAHDAIDPFPNNTNKWKMIAEMNTEGAKENYYLNFMKYHTRWKELTKGDFDFAYKMQTDPMRGFVFLTQVKANTCMQLSYEEVNAAQLPDRKIHYLQKTVELIRECGSEPLILLSPYDTAVDESSKIKALNELCTNLEVPFLDLNSEYNNLGIDNAKDYYDGGHFNVYGAEKASRYIADYIENNFILSAEKAENSTGWQDDIAYYYENRNMGNRDQ